MCDVRVPLRSLRWLVNKCFILKAALAVGEGQKGIASAETTRGPFERRLSFPAESRSGSDPPPRDRESIP